MISNGTLNNQTLKILTTVSEDVRKGILITNAICVLKFQPI